METLLKSLSSIITITLLGFCATLILVGALVSCTQSETSEVTVALNTGIVPSTGTPPATIQLPYYTPATPTFQPITETPTIPSSTPTATGFLLPTSTANPTLPTLTPTDSPQPPVVKTPSATEIIAHLEEGEIYYLDGGLFPTEIWKVDLRTMEKTQLFRSGEPGFEVSGIALSPDKTRLVFSYSVWEPANWRYLYRSGLNMIQTDTLESQTVVEMVEEDGVVVSPHWSPDGTTLAYLDVRDRFPDYTSGISATLYLHTLELDSGHNQIIMDDGGSFDWSPKGDRIVVAGWHALYVLDLKSGEQETLWEDENLFFAGSAWQPGGEQVAVSVRGKLSPPSNKPESGLYVIDVATRIRHQIVSGDIGQVYWSPDGSKLVYLTLTTRTTRLWSVDVESGSPIRLVGPTALMGSPAWSANGEVLLLAIEEELDRSYWVSIMAVQDRSLLKLVLTETRHPYSTW